MRVNLRCGTAQDLADTGAGLRLVDPKGYETDASITSLVDTLVRSRIDAWVADRSDGSFGIEKADCRAILVFEDGKDPHTILLGADGESGVFGMIEGQPEVFVAPKSLKELMSGIYVNRAMTRAGPAKITLAGQKPIDIEDFEALYAERVSHLGAPSIKPIAITIESKGDAGSIRITCSNPAAGGLRSCAKDGVNATFEVLGHFEKLATDAGAR